VSEPVATCFRCDWEGTADGAACPRCGAPLYRAGQQVAVAQSGATTPRSTPAVTSPSGREPAAAPAHDAAAGPPSEPRVDGDRAAREQGRPTTGTAGQQDVVVDGGDHVASRPRAASRHPLRIVAAVVVVVVIAAFLSAAHRSHPRPAAQGIGTIHGTLVYASAGGDGATGRLWRVSLDGRRPLRGPRTVLPDEIVPSGPGERWVGIRAGGAAYVFRDLSAGGTPQFVAEGELVAWAPGGNAVFLVTREASARGRCPLLRLTFVSSISHGQADLYAAPSCSTADGLAVDGLTRPFVSLEGPTDAGVYELGYQQLHLVVPRYSLLSVSPSGDMLVGPRIAAPASGTPWPAARTLLVWQGIGGPSVVGNEHGDFVAERFLAWSKDGRRAALLGTLGGVRSVWLVKTEVGTGRERPVRVAPALSSQIRSVGAAFTGNTVLAAAAGHVYASAGRGYREIELPAGAPPPSGPLLWLDR
jgi:hypothetical protein